MNNEEKPKELENAFETKKQKIIDILKKHDVSLEGWGKGSAKTIEHLVREVADGETVLEEDGSGELMRVVSIVYVDIYYADKNTGNRLKLVEEKQVFKDGRERTRKSLGGSIAEKLKVEESPDAKTVNRAICEELGVNCEEMHSIGKGKEEVIQDSPSYPGLKMKAIKYFFEVELGEDQYKPEGYVEQQQDKDTFFKWV
tara:strand:- start:16 stop:612 length:597 start_codon:yes stop_codon:yes gene_type:complete